MNVNCSEPTLHDELAVLIGNGLRVDVDRLRRDEPFAEVIPNFDSLSMLEMLLIIEEKEGFSFDRHLGPGNPPSAANAADATAQPAFPLNVSALAQAILEARRKEMQAHADRHAEKAADAAAAKASAS